MNIIGVLIKNISGYDTLIWIAGFINIIIFFNIRKITNKVHKALYPQKNMALTKMIELNIPKKSDENNDIVNRLNSLFDEEKKGDRLYGIYISLTSIFPLMGIAGTVLALLMIKDFSSASLSTNFTFALTSTFWGVVWGGICKVLEGFIEPKIYRNNEDLRIIRDILKVGGSFE